MFAPTLIDLGHKVVALSGCPLLCHNFQKIAIVGELVLRKHILFLSVAEWM